MLPKLAKAVSPRKFYEELLGCKLPADDGNGDVKIHCPFHNARTGAPDAHASMSVSLLPEKYGAYKCFGGSCGAHGTMVQFYQELHHITDVRQAIDGICNKFRIDPSTFKTSLIDLQSVREWRLALTATREGKRLLEHLLTKRCLSMEIVERFNLGYSQPRLTIPIIDAAGDVVNVRRWLPEYERRSAQDKKFKIISEAGYGVNRLFPYTALSEQTIVLCEGELDALALHTIGINAITATAGVASLTEGMAGFFKDKDVYVLFDNDTAGESSTPQTLTRLYKHVRTLYVVTWLWPECKDITDVCYALRDRAAEEIRAAISSSPPFYIKSDESTHDVSLYQATAKHLINKRVKVPGIVTAKNLGGVVMGVPTRITAVCGADKPAKTCMGCPHRITGTDTVVKEIELDSQEMLTIIEKGLKSSVLKQIFKIGDRCPVEFTFDCYENVEPLQLIPDTDIQSDAASYEYVYRDVYAVGTDHMLNKRYSFTGKVLVNELAVVKHIFTSAEPLDKMSVDMRPDSLVEIDGTETTVDDALSIFRPNNNDIEGKLQQIYDDLTIHVTKIVGRHDVMEVMDLVWHSPLSYVIGEDVMHRGWMSALIVGDTQCGKSETAIKLQRHYRLGQMYSGESISRAGIVGAYTPGKGGEVMFRLGVAPLNDGRLLILDEATGLSKEQFDELTMLRSTGEAVSTKYGQHHRFPARVRLIALSNPRNEMRMRQHIYGCTAIREIVGGDADIARFDMFCTVADDEVSLEHIHAPIVREHQPIYTSDLCNLMVQFAWTRKASDYIFTQKAIEHINAETMRMSNKYDTALPLVAGSSHRHTIARIAAAMATRLYNVNGEGRIVITENHASAACAFLYQLYDKPSMGYDRYSARRKSVTSMPDKHLGLVAKLLNNSPYVLILTLIDVHSFTTRDLQDQTGIHQSMLMEVLPRLRVLGALSNSKGKWYKTPAFSEFLLTFKHKDAESDDPTGLTMYETEVDGDARFM